MRDRTIAVVNFLVWAAVVAVAFVFVWLIWDSYYYNSYEWTGIGEFSKQKPPDVEYQRGKTLWDWLGLFVVPATLLLGGYWLNSVQKKREDKRTEQRAKEKREIAEERTQETALQNCLDQISKLLLNEIHLTESPHSDAADIARVWTRTTMRRLNGERRGILLRFLCETDLITDWHHPDTIIDLISIDLHGSRLSGANLSGANFRGANLGDADFSDADFSGAKSNNGSFLSGADFSGANLSGANFRGANLSGVFFSGANLSGADFRGANLGKSRHILGGFLSGANFSEANLSGANFRGVTYTEETRWPDGFDPVQAGGNIGRVTLAHEQQPHDQGHHRDANLARLTFCKIQGHNMRQGKQRAGRAINPAYGLGDNPAAADVVRRIFAEFTHPYRHATLSEIAAGLNIDQAATQRGGKWHASTVRYVLRNPVYIDLVGGEVFDAAQSRLARLQPGPPR